nr:MND1-interacting protein 1 [Ipomoea batatas]
MKAARKLSSDLTELKMLRMEREETQSVKKGKQTIADNIMKKLTELENALRKASGEVDRVNSGVRKLEAENAEMEACKLSASESATTFMEVAKREKKCQKKISAWEKQKSKLQGDIAAEKYIAGSVWVSKKPTTSSDALSELLKMLPENKTSTELGGGRGRRSRNAGHLPRFRQVM